MPDHLRRWLWCVGVPAAMAIGTAARAHHAAPDDELARARDLAQQVTITRDRFGVPHVHSRTDAGAVFGGLFARAEDEMARIEVSHAEIIGLAGLVHGERGRSWDRFVLSFEIPDLAKREHAAAPPDVQALTQAAADALNLYLDLHPEFEPRAIHHWEPWMFHACEYAWTLPCAQEEAERVVAESRADQPTASQPAVQPASQPARSSSGVDGSNAWAIAPSRTASGHPMLYINPHIPLDEPYEIHLRSDEGLNIAGFVAYGDGLIPSAGFNERLGWTLTVNYVDIADAYAVKFDVPGDPLAYRHGEKVLHATRWTASAPHRTENGIEQQEFTLYKTHHGPLVYESNGTSYAVRTARIENLRAVEQWYRMAKARNIDEWRRAISMFGVVFHNFVYADVDGNIGYVYNAAFPRRDPDFNWSATFDGHDPRTDWLGYHSLEEIPQVWNPPCGYVQNCNSSPLVTAAEGENPDRTAFPPYIIGHDLADGRIAMSHAILSAAKAWTLDDLERAAFDTTVHSLDASRMPLLRDDEWLCDHSPEAATRIEEAIAIIRDWDGRLAIDSVASTLYCEWIDKLFSADWVKRRGPGDLSAALSEVMASLEREFGTWRVPWGDINRHQRFDSHAGFVVSDDRESSPIAGGHGGLGIPFCYLSREDGTRRRYGYHGHSFVAAVEFGDPVSARSIVPFGASRDPKSAHFNDQAPLYAAGRLKPCMFTTAEVMLGAARTYHPGE